MKIIHLIHLKGSRYFVRFSLSIIDINIELDDFTIYQTVQLLQPYSLVHTYKNIEGIDIKGRVWEKMVGNTFRGELGQFFTPREIVEFMVNMAGPSPDEIVYDPACGSGGFLIMFLNYIEKRVRNENPNLSETELALKLKYITEHNTFGTDINDRMTRVCKMNMIMHGDGHSGIFNVNGLAIHHNKKVTSRIKLGTT